MRKISFGGLLLAKGSLMLVPSIRLSFTRNLSVFLGRVFGELRLLRKWLFFRSDGSAREDSYFGQS